MFKERLSKIKKHFSDIPIEEFERNIFKQHASEVDLTDDGNSKINELMVDLDKLEQEINIYFANITKEELKKDLESVGLIEGQVS